MKDPVLKLHPKDNIITALENLPKGMVLSKDDSKTVLEEDIPAKHKFTIQDLDEGDLVYMYGVQVGKTSKKIARGALLHINNLEHSVESYSTRASHTREWLAPDISNWSNRTFNGYYRDDGSVGVANFWLVIPLVFCENRNINVLKNSLSESLGYVTDLDYQVDIQLLINKYKEGADKDTVLDSEIIKSQEEITKNRLFENVDGIKFLTHQGGCGSSKGDTEALCQLLAGYITNPNVAGATVLSLGCEHAQITILEKAIRTRD
ncbi:MAG: UxaA family hydrolase, partial [Bacteroidetes bacterium]|nr:UxaA family hydrolase [Bacteroidota bacterium]